MLKRYQEIGDTGTTPMRDIIKACKENPNIIISYEGDIPFSGVLRATAKWRI